MYRFKLLQAKRAITYITFSLLLSSTILILNFIYFSAINPSTTTFLNYFGYNINNLALSDITSAKLAIIIDDFGQNRKGVQEMMSIKRHLTFAVMPFLTYSKIDAEAAYEKGYEVIVHLPMESNNGKLSWVGPRPILSVMSDNEVYQTVIDSFDDVPHAIGANIHMGAKAGNDERIVSSILDVIKAKKVYFVDSRSSNKPIAKKIADEKGALCYDRDVFIDGKQSKEYTRKQLKRAADIALSKGKAIAIGHVGTEGGKATADAIEDMLPYFDEKKVELVFVSELSKPESPLAP